jgi:hypothetical protein
MRILIDGHNLIPKIPGMRLGSMDDEEALIAFLQKIYKTPKDRVEVFFDKAAAGHAGKKTFGKVIAHFIHSRRTADDAIRDRLRSLGKDAANWTVVSSDRQVQAEARAARAGVMTGENFIRSLVVAGKEKEDPGRKDEINESEIDEWMRIFGEKDS